MSCEFDFLFCVGLLLCSFGVVVVHCKIEFTYVVHRVPRIELGIYASDRILSRRNEYQADTRLDTMLAISLKLQ